VRPAPVAPREPYPYEVDLAVAVTAAVEAARAQLRARPPEECARCGGRKGFYRQPNTADGWWRCWTCHGGTFRALPTPAEEAEATRTARETAEAEVLDSDPGVQLLRRQVAFDRTRDRRRAAAVHAAMSAALLARYAPGRYPLPAAAREWQGLPLVDFARTDAELRDDVQTFDLPRRELATRALRCGSYE
jgi:hypothetical protein